MKKCLLLMFGVLLAALIFPQSVKASDWDEIATYTTVTIKATVPEDFTDEIVFILEDEFQITTPIALNKDNGYAGSVSVIGGKTYLAKIKLPDNSKDKYQSDLAEQYLIDGQEVELSFTVKPMVYSIENEDETEKETVERPHGEDIDPETGLATPESVISTYLETVAFAKDDPNFKVWRGMHDSEDSKNIFLNIDPLNTEEQWNNMDGFERRIYYVLYTLPYTEIIKKEYQSENQFIERFFTEKGLLENIEKGEIVYEAEVEVWKWQYQYWQVTGTFYNFFSHEEDKTVAAEIKEESPVVLTEEDKEVIAEIEKELGIEKEKESPVFEAFKKYWFSLVILAAAGIAFLVVFLKNHKKNIYDGSDK